MLVYENNNKLNINFDNEVSENPDLQIGKSGDETKVLIDGQPIGSGGGSFVVHLTPKDPSIKKINHGKPIFILDKTAKEIKEHIDRDGLVAALNIQSDEYGSFTQVGFFNSYEITEDGYTFNNSIVDPFYAVNESDYPETSK